MELHSFDKYLAWWPGLWAPLSETGGEADVSPDVGQIMDHLDTIVKTPSCEVSPCRHRCPVQVVVACQMIFINNISNLMFRAGLGSLIINYQSSPGKMTIPC